VDSGGRPSGQLFYGSRWLSPLAPGRPLRPQIDQLNRAPERFGFDYVGYDADLYRVSAVEAVLKLPDAFRTHRLSCDSPQAAGPAIVRTRRNLSWGGE
jgi:hypothetical protein